MLNRRISAIALAKLASFALSLSVTPAAARMTECQIRYSYCAEHCIMNNSGGGISACFSRTCDHQYQNCARDSGESRDPNHDIHGSGGRGGRGGRIRRLAVPQSPASGVDVLGGGILSADPGITTQGPAGAGSPVAPAAVPAPPRVIIQ
jgi:hypothetical protein